LDWLMREQGPKRPVNIKAPQADINSDALVGAISAVEDLLEARKAKLPPDKKGKLVMIVYKQLIRDGGRGTLDAGLIDDLLDWTG
jgi:hypothetical protein